MNDDSCDMDVLLPVVDKPIRLQQSRRYQHGCGYTHGHSRLYGEFWHEPVMRGWRWKIVISPYECASEVLAMGVLRSTLIDCVSDYWQAINDPRFAQMLTAWKPEQYRSRMDK